MVNSIYTHKEIFLREIISNASDACDKLCYQALTDDAVGMSRKDFKIEIKVDKEHRTLTVSDNGIGMDKEDLENNLGVIASSGSYKFKQEVGDDAKDTDVIGQFGVGFYSAFMVADYITVVTRKYGADAAWMWQSSGADGYTITVDGVMGDEVNCLIRYTLSSQDGTPSPSPVGGRGDLPGVLLPGRPRQPGILRRGPRGRDHPVCGVDLPPRGTPPGDRHPHLPEPLLWRLWEGRGQRHRPGPLGTHLPPDL